MDHTSQDNQVAPGGAFRADSGVDKEIGSVVVRLYYEDGAASNKNLTVGIAPELGSNMFQFTSVPMICSNVTGKYCSAWALREILSCGPCPTELLTSAIHFKGQHTPYRA